MKNSIYSPTENPTEPATKKTETRQITKEKPDESVRKDDSQTLEQSEPICFGIHIGKKHISEFIQLKKKLQVGNSETVHKAIELANKYLNICKQAKPCYVIHRDLIEEESKVKDNC